MAPATLDVLQYARVSTQAHAVLSLGVLASTLGFGSHALLVETPQRDAVGEQWVAAAVRRYPQLGHMQAPHAPYIASGVSLVLSGAYLLLRVLMLCSGCVASGFVWRDVVQRQHLAISACLVCAGGVELLHAVALLPRRQPPTSSGKRNSLITQLRSRATVFRSGWTHDIWCIHIIVIALIFLGHPQADAQRALIHVIIGLSLLLGAHAIVVEKKSGFGAVDLETDCQSQPRCLIPSAGCFIVATISLVSYGEKVEAIDGEALHAGYASECFVVGRALAAVAGLVTGATILLGMPCVCPIVRLAAYVTLLPQRTRSDLGAQRWAYGRCQALGALFGYDDLAGAQAGRAHCGAACLVMRHGGSQSRRHSLITRAKKAAVWQQLSIASSVRGHHSCVMLNL